MTPRRVVTTRQADEDIDDAVTYYVASGANEAALGFVDALENARDLLADYPSIGSSRFAIATGIPDLRDLSLRRFPYTLMYTEDTDAVRIHRVLHTRRDIASELVEP